MTMSCVCKTIRRQFNSSRVILFLQETKVLTLVCLVEAVLLTLISYPGFYYSDSYGRINWANLLISYAKSGAAHPVTPWVSPVPSLFLAIFKVLVGSFSGYILVQSFSFFYVTSLLIMRFTGSKLRLGFFLICPVIFAVSVYLEPGIGVCVGIGVLVLVLTSNLIREPVNVSLIDRVLVLFALVAGTFIAIGFRPNTLTILPIVVLWCAVLAKNRIWKVVFISTIALGTVLAFAVPIALGFYPSGTAGTGLVWEILVAIKQLPADRQREYGNYFDSISSPGATGIALENLDADPDTEFDWFTFEDPNTNLNMTFEQFGKNPSISAAQLTKAGSFKLFGMYLYFISKEPVAWLQSKMRFINKSMGIAAPIHLNEWYYNRYNRMKEFGFSDSSRRMQLFKSYEWSVTKIAVLRMPFIWFIVGLVITARNWRTRKDQRSLLLFLLAVFYYGAFLLNTQSFEFRYFYPSFWLLAILIVSGIENPIDLSRIRRCKLEPKRE